MAEDHALETTNPLDKKLHAKQIRFIHEYLIDRNATAAYQRAGYVATRESARRNAHTLLTNPDISAAIKAAEQEVLEQVRMRLYEIHGALRINSLSSIDDYKIDEEGNLTLAPGVERAALRAISSYQRKTTHQPTKRGVMTTHDVKLTLWNKNDALRMAGQAAHMFEPEKEEASDSQQANNNYFLTLIQIIQKRGLSSTVGADEFTDTGEPALDITPTKNGTTNNGHNGTNGEQR